MINLNSLCKDKICKIGGIFSIIGIILSPLLLISAIIIWYDSIPYKFLENIIMYMPTVVLIAGLFLMCVYQKTAFRILLILAIISISFQSMLPYVQKEVVREIIPHVLVTSMNNEVISRINPLSDTYFAIFSLIWLGLHLLLYVSVLGALKSLTPKIQKKKSLYKCLSFILAFLVVVMVFIRVFSIVHIFSLSKDNALYAVTLNGLRLGYDVSISNLRLFNPPFEFIIMNVNLISLFIFNVLIIALIIIFINNLSKNNVITVQNGS